MSGKHRRLRRTAGRRRLASGAMVTVLTPAMATFGAQTAGAADDPVTGQALGLSTFSGQASADGIRARIALTDYLIVEDFVDGGGPTAQAGLDSLGESSAFASLPYPGATGVAFPGLISTLSGKSVPSYPFIAASQAPSNPEVTISQPGYIMHAESTDTRSAADTQLGASTTTGEEFGTFSTALVEVVDGVLTSRGEARSRLAIGVFALNGAVSKAQVVRGADGKTVKTASFEGGVINLAGMQIGVTDKGLVIGPQGAPLDSASVVSDAFSASGVTIKFLPAVETADSILSSGLEISMARAVPNVGNATAVVSYIVGRTFAQAEADSAAAPAAAGVAPDTTPSVTDEVAEVAEVAGPVLPVDAPVVAGPAGVGTAPDPAGGDVAPTVDLINTAASDRELTEISFYPLLAALVPVLVLAALGARQFI